MLARLSNGEFERKRGICAPADEDQELEACVQTLREAGERVIKELDADKLSAKQLRLLGCDRRLVRAGQQWQLENLDAV